MLAWLATLANIAGVDLDAAVQAKYGGGCPGCHRSPCCAMGRRNRELSRFATRRIGLLFFGFGVCAAGATVPPRIEEGGIRIGLRDGPKWRRSRNGVWAPVAVPIKAGREDVPRQTVIELVVETTDGEAMPYRYIVPVPSIPANSERPSSPTVVRAGAALRSPSPCRRRTARDVQMVEATQPRFQQKRNS